MILIAGLGNPGKEYSNTRHNIGFMAVDLLQQELAPNEKWSKNSKLHSEIIKTNEVILVKPETFMNLSGKAIQAVQQMYKVEKENIWILHDEMDLELGRIKIQTGGGSAGHNGIKSIIESIGTNEFNRWRIGIGRPPQEFSNSADFVLDQFASKEAELVAQILQKVEQSILFAIKNNVIASMNKYN